MALTLVHGIFDRLLHPLSGLTPAAAMVVICAAVGLLAAIVFRVATNQRKVARAADQATAELLAVKLFKHDPLAVLRAELRMFRALARRLWLTLPATAILAVPLVLLLMELAPRYERRPLRPGEAAVVEVFLNDQGAESRPSQGTVFETPPLRDADHASIAWRVRATASSPVELRWHTDFKEVMTRLDVDAQPDGRWLRLDRSSPAPLRAIEIHYPRRDFAVAGVSLPWWLAFFVGATLFAWLFGKVLGVRY